MSNCIGFAGKLFGHKFESLIINSAFPLSLSIKQFNAEILDQCKNKTYEVRCKRCGKMPDREQL